jgi:hypothetical protein
MRRFRPLSNGNRCIEGSQCPLLLAQQAKRLVNQGAGIRLDAPRIVPKPEIRQLDHIVGAGEQRRRDFNARCLLGPEADDELELRRLLDR